MKPVRIAVVGAGISGLTTAFYLKRLSHERSDDCQIRVLETRDRVGGVIRSEQTDGFILEFGPEGWASYKPAAKMLVKDLGLMEDLIGSNDQNRKTFIVNNGDLSALPNGMAFFAPVDPISFWRSAPMSWRGKLRASLEPLVQRSSGDLSVQEFFTRRLGREFTQEIVEPLISAILGSDFSKISAQSALPELYGVEQRVGSLWKGMRRFANMPATVSVLNSMRNGMSQVIDGLEQALGEEAIQFQVGEMELSQNGKQYRLRSSSFDDEFDAVVFSSPAPATARILRPLLPEASGLLDQIPYGSSHLVYLSYDREEFSRPLDGFGFIVPSRYAGLVDACTWVSTKWNGRCPDDAVLIRCAIHEGRKSRPDYSDEALAQLVHEEVSRLLKVNCSPTTATVFRHRKALPQMLVGHKTRLGQVEQALKGNPRLKIAASFWGGVGVPDCIKTAQQTALQLVEEIWKRPEA